MHMTRKLRSFHPLSPPLPRRFAAQQLQPQVTRCGKEVTVVDRRGNWVKGDRVMGVVNGSVGLEK